MKNNVDKALWFLGSFGLQFDSMQLKDLNIGEKHTISTGNVNKSYSEMCDEQK